MCLKHGETLDHIFKNCEWSKKVQFEFESSLNINFDANNDQFTNWIWDTMAEKDKATVKKVMTTMYSIWWSGNTKVFQNYKSSIEDTTNYPNYMINQDYTCYNNQNIINNQTNRRCKRTREDNSYHNNIIKQAQHGQNDSITNQQDEQSLHPINCSDYWPKDKAKQDRYITDSKGKNMVEMLSHLDQNRPKILPQ